MPVIHEKCGIHGTYYTPTITPTRDKCDAIRRVEKLSTVKDVRAFCGMVNYLSMYLKGLQEL